MLQSIRKSCLHLGHKFLGIQPLVSIVAHNLAALESAKTTEHIESPYFAYPSNPKIPVRDLDWRAKAKNHGTQTLETLISTRFPS